MLLPGVCATLGAPCPVSAPSEDSVPQGGGSTLPCLVLPAADSLSGFHPQCPS
ncbi:hypothetical protein I79_007620 [Cricetulus griseus]|uniref:Uncharacterized protein n=1 Tax=Cricetulus griseus TaxID=10029 RepID=G3HB07_CRIGR|nr:hypothetical protein I79_007620 [Cricetulus griseus]